MPEMSVSFLWSFLVKDPLIILCTVLMGSISFVTSIVDREGRLTDKIARRWARMLLWLGGVRVRIRGEENIDSSRNYVFVGNHLSLFDTPVVLGNVPVRFLFLVSSKYVELPFLGTHLRRSGHFSVDQDDPRSALKTMTQAAQAARRKNLSILLFPEGSRAPGEMAEFKEGAAYIAIKAGVPVIPFAIQGTRKVLPIGSVHIRGGVVDLLYGEPIPTEGYAVKNRTELNDLMFQRVSALVRELREESTKPAP